VDVLHRFRRRRPGRGAHRPGLPGAHQQGGACSPARHGLRALQHQPGSHIAARALPRQPVMEEHLPAAALRHHRRGQPAHHHPGLAQVQTPAGRQRAGR